MTVTRPVRPAAAPPVGLADVRRPASCSPASSRRTPMAKLAGAERAVRRPGAGSSARTCSAPARSRSAAPTCGSPGSTPRSGPAGVVAASAGNHAQGVALAAQLLGIRATVFMPERRAAAEGRARPAATAPTCTWSARRSTRALAAARAFAERDRRGAHPPVRPRRRHRRPGHRRAGDPRAGARTCATVLVADRRRRAARRRRGGGQGAAPGRAGRRRAGARAPRRARPRWPRARRSALPVDAHDRRRHRGRPAGRRHVRRRSPRLRRRDPHRLRGRRSRGRCCTAWSGRSWSSSRPARRRWPRCWTHPQRLRDAGGRRALRRQHRPAAAAAT